MPAKIAGMSVGGHTLNSTGILVAPPIPITRAVFIVRTTTPTTANNFANLTGQPPAISAEEWHAVVAEDPTMELVGMAKLALPNGRVLMRPNPNLAAWHAPHVDAPVWFDFVDGAIAVKNPDATTTAKLRELARQLGGRVLTHAIAD